MIRRILRIGAASLSIILFVWFAAPIAYRILNAGNLLGMLMCIALFFRTALSPLYHRIKSRMQRRKPLKIILRIVQIGSSAFLLYGAVISSFMVYAMIPRETNGATAVVLGAQVHSWGPSAILQQRIDAAERYLNSHPDAAAILTGGQGDDEIVSEAACMYQVMIADGISPSRIYQEDQARNTDENIRFSLKVIDDRHLCRDIAVVTDSYHQLRARIIAHKQDADLLITPVNTVNSASGFWLYPTYFVREWIAIPVEIWK